MNSLERILSAVQFQQPDRVPVLPVLLLQGAKELKLSLPEYFQDARNLIAGQKALVEKYHHDGVYGIPHVVEDIEAFGGEIAYCQSGPPTVARLAWQNWQQVTRLQTPVVENVPALVRTLSTLQGLADAFKGEKLIIGAAIAPFSLPSMLIGTDAWFQLLWEDELLRKPIMDDVLAICKDFCVKWSSAQLQAGADVVVLADGMASATCIMREQFQTMALPVIKATIDAIPGTVVYEPVGHIEPFIDLIGDIGAGVLALECTDDIGKCKQVLAGKMAVMGNLNNIEMIRWSRQDALHKSREVLDRAAPGSGFILAAQGPEIPWSTPGEVIAAIVEAAATWKPTS